MQHWETDPTLHDFRPPEVTIHQAKFETEPGYSEYAILYGAEDPSGVTRVQFIKEGDIHEDLQFDGQPTNIGGRVYFTVGFFETSADAVTGTTVDITAEDVHNSKTRELAVERANFYGNLAGELDHSNIYTQTAAYQLAQISGFTSSWGSTAREAKQGAEGTVEAYQALRDDPVEYLRGVVGIVEVLERYGILDTLVEVFVGPLQDKQETNNPYDEAENPTLYATYKVGWYEGFVAGKVSQIVVTFGAGQAVKGTTTAKRVDGFVSSTKTYKIAKRIKSPYDTTKARIAAKLVDGTQRVGSGVLGRTRTVAQQIRVTQALRRTDIDTSDLSDKDIREVSEIIIRTDASDKIDPAGIANEVDEFVEVSKSRRAVTIVAERDGADVELVYPNDGEQYVRTVGKVERRSLNGLSNLERGDIAEEGIAPHIARKRGYDVKNPFDAGTQDTGFDTIAYDSDNEEWVIIEAKFKSTNGRVTKSWMDDTKTKGRQMSDEWVTKTLNEMRAKAETDEELSIVRKLRRAQRQGGPFEKRLLQSKMHHGRAPLQAVH